MIFTAILILCYLFFLILIAQIGKKGLVYFVLLNFLIDLIIGFVESGAFFGTARHLLNFICIIFFLFFLKPRPKVPARGQFILLTFIGYLTILFLLSDNFLDSVLTYLPFVSTLLMYIVGYRAVSTSNFAKLILKPLLVILLIFPFYTLLAQIFKFGQSYSEEFSVGFLTTSRIYIISLVIVLVPAIIDLRVFGKRWIRSLLTIFTVVNFMILVINLRRTSIVLVATGLMLYATLRKRISIGLTIMVSCILLIGYLVLGDLLSEQLAARERITNVESYSEEGRLTELISFVDFYGEQMNMQQRLFGYNFFQTEEFGYKYFGRPRTIHGDFLTIFFSMGLVGFILFCSFVFSLVTIRKKYKNTREVKSYLHTGVYRTIYWVVLLQFVFVLLPGRFIGQFTYAGLLMLLLGVFSNFILYKPEDESIDS